MASYSESIENHFILAKQAMLFDEETDYICMDFMKYHPNMIKKYIKMSSFICNLPK